VNADILASEWWRAYKTEPRAAQRSSKTDSGLASAIRRFVAEDVANCAKKACKRLQEGQEELAQGQRTVAAAKDTLPVRKGRSPGKAEHTSEPPKESRGPARRRKASATSRKMPPAPGSQSNFARSGWRVEMTRANMLCAGSMLASSGRDKPRYRGREANPTNRRAAAVLPLRL